MASPAPSSEFEGFEPTATATDSPRIAVQQSAEADDDDVAPASESPVRRSASPMRQHRRTPSAHREIKETLDAHVDFTNDECDGRTYQQVNQYTIADEIGRGSFGSVHRAVDQFGKEFSHLLRLGPHGLPRHVITQDGPLSPELRSLRASEKSDALFFIREEIAIMKKLDHPNLVQLIELLDDPEEDSLYMVLEMCKKGVVMAIGLDGDATPYNDETCRCWFRDLILGIEYLHSQGVIHRDIKPDNLLLCENDVLKVSDFGVSEMFEKPGEMMTVKSAGSPAFLPPELCGRHREVSGTAADIWSMGVSLYCLKYGKLPFNRPSILEIFEAIKTEDVQVADHEDANFVDLMHSILDKDPDTRITMAELRNHPWVTQNGTDPLLSAEENCAHQVEPPNELELNRAITRKMNDLMCVVKAIRKFKTQLASIRLRARESEDEPATGSSSATTVDRTGEPTGREAIEAIAHRRRSLLLRVDGAKGEQGLGQKDHGKQAGDQEPLFLGIGTGARDDFAMDAATPDAVADSPKTVDYDIYDRAYEDAVERQLKASWQGRPTLYLTKFVKEAGNLTRAVKEAEKRCVEEAEHRIAQGTEHKFVREAERMISKEAGRLDGLMDKGGTGQRRALEADMRQKGRRLRHHLASGELGGLASRIGLSDAETRREGE
ncbi:hypothetical protein XA68_10118 [Ophiocordyceps unilateralis]|uniref:Protein kinase domain-containing protein n=1 Tax=Ophiocordyceps unilateralis TaxID=268505 RepID=A0A2A9PJ58_OPHUN|nr:hypothetical protein XA68_10118 [Ophiocordyceps unilateralis]